MGRGINDEVMGWGQTQRGVRIKMMSRVVRGGGV